MESERIRARRAKTNEERHFQSTRRNFQIFVKNRIRRGESLIWKTHVAEVSEEAVLRYCVGCKRTHHRGSTLWWRRKEDGEYDCSTCFMKDWSRVSPLGYEHRTFTRKRNPNQETASEEPTSDLATGSEPESESTSKSV
ncbi:hypothetical protein D6D01_08323 [Aureobasidium pullulans]|uniref:GATA-type domain-containing protein n=1 Tax=Aureobasidium pullulans TaxID=5580 RepID=A0A4S9KDT7_AURPU|nr:hypothetical protein D6D01_08323 [Aureobasidium pullulans]